MLNICQIVITGKTTLIGRGKGRFHSDCYNKLKTDVISANVVNVLARIVDSKQCFFDSASDSQDTDSSNESIICIITTL